MLSILGKWTSFIFKKISIRIYIVWCGCRANLVSRDCASKGSDLIRNRQFPLSLRCSLAECYFSRWLYCIIKHTQQSQLTDFPEWISCVIAYLWQILVLSLLTVTLVISDMLGGGLGFLLILAAESQPGSPLKPNPYLCFRESLGNGNFV